MSLKLSTKVETNLYELEVEVDAKTFCDALQAVYKKEVKNISVQGFRKGKAPRAIIEKMYGENVFFEDAINAVYPTSLDAAIAEAGLEFLDVDGQVELVSATKEEGVSYKVKVVTRPVAEISSYKGLEATKPAVEVTEEEVAHAVSDIQNRNARTVDVTDRAAIDGDITKIDFEGFVDGVAFDGGKGEDFDLTLGSGQFIPGFEAQIVGHNIGEEFDVCVKFPADYQAEELADKDAVFKCTVKAISARELPEVNDELISDATEFDTVDAFKADASAKIASQKEKAAADSVDNQLIDALLANTTVEIPEVMFKSRVDAQLQDFDYRLQSQGLNMEQYMQYTGMTKESLGESMRPQAEKQVKLRLALEKVAELEAFVVSDEDCDAELTKMAEGYQMTLEQIKSFVPVDEMKKDMAVEKAMNFVRDNASVATEV